MVTDRFRKNLLVQLSGVGVFAACDGHIAYASRACRRAENADGQMDKENRRERI